MSDIEKDVWRLALNLKNLLLARPFEETIQERHLLLIIGEKYPFVAQSDWFKKWLEFELTAEEEGVKLQ